MSDRENLSDHIDLLRKIVPELRGKLEAAEEYRALRQLDERESKNDPLEAIDGVLLRGRLAQHLERTNRYWRALVRIEAAIAELEGDGPDEPRSLIADRQSAAAPIGPPEQRRNKAPDACDLTSEPLRSAEPIVSARRHARTASPASSVPTSLSLVAGDRSDRHRTIVNRIRPGSGLTAQTRGSEAETASSGDVAWAGQTPALLPPAIESMSAPAGGANDQRASIATKAGEVADAPRGANPNRLDTLERELARLIANDGTAVELPDSQANEFSPSQGPAERNASSELDVGGELGPDSEVEEAEVTIVKLQEPVTEPDSLAGAKFQSRVEFRPASRIANRMARPDRTDRKIAARDDGADVADDGLTVEEAVVEIVVPGRRAGNGSASDRSDS